MNFPEYQSIVSEYEIGLLIDDLSPANLLPALKQLLNDEQLYQRLVNNCKTAKLEYTWENESQKLINFYQAICPLN